MKLGKSSRWIAAMAVAVLICGNVVGSMWPAPKEEGLKPPPEFVPDASGTTHVPLMAAESEIQVGDASYRSLVFNGQYDAPLIRTRPGGVIAVDFDNRMDEITNLHFHGMQVSALEAGDNIFRIAQPHTRMNYTIKLPPNHSPGVYWYHSHFHGAVQRQVSGGIAGPILVEGMLDPFPELRGIKEQVLVMRNFQKTHTGKLASRIITGAPSIRTINGQFQPEIRISPGETQLWHLLNVAANQYFRLKIHGQDVQVISRDGNSVVKEDREGELLMGPSARVSVLVVGPEPGRYPIELGKVNTGPAGDAYDGARLATMVSVGERVTTKRITSPYPQYADLSKQPVARKRRYVFQDSATDPNTFMINGRRFDGTRVDTTVKLGDVEEWRLENPTQELHQFHIHQTDFQVVAINDKPVPFTSYRDNTFIPATGSITVRIPFIEEVTLGKFVYHCHVLEHEDGGMMQVIQVVRPKDYEQAVTLEPLGGIYGDNETCTYLQKTGNELQISPALLSPLPKAL
ncbi:multicopper oxidase family protein [Luteimonas salinilitoris]|uniref:Multicopper oxidase family protein n=1 Tax=Luteimonas salinilitoris TaxID=3237697 RepID=A0ABV4HMD1_9GAMM